VSRRFSTPHNTTSRPVAHAQSGFVVADVADERIGRGHLHVLGFEWAQQVYRRSVKVLMGEPSVVVSRVEYDRHSGVYLRH
jgi:hypothetical protein